MNFFKAGKYNLEIGKKTYVMGILNVTPDSFSDGGKFIDPEKAINRALEIQSEGADIIDIGAQSTRPGYEKISPKQEWQRLSPVLKSIHDKLSIPISVDTFYPEVAQEALKFSVDIINDVSGFGEDMMAVAKKSDCGCIIMHDKPGVDTIKPFFEKKLEFAALHKIDTSRICFDPGIGFSKTYEENLDIIKNLKKIKIDNITTLIGLSKKRVIKTSCGSSDMNDRTYGTIAANTLSIAFGADIIRVHDVKESVLAARVTDAILRR